MTKKENLQEFAMSRATRLSYDDLEKQIAEKLGAPYAEYREHWKQSSIFNGDPLSFPIHLDLELNDICNQSCIMCPRNEEIHQINRFKINTNEKLDNNIIFDVIKDASKRGLKSINFGAFAEPLIHKNLWNLIKFSHENGIVDSRVITNGLLLNRFTEEIFASGLINLFVSIDANSPETYTKIRGKGFQKVRQNVIDLAEEKKRRNSFFPIIRVSWVDMEINSHEKDDFVEFWSEIVNHVDIQNWSNFAKNANPEELLNPKQFECRSPWQRVSILANGEILPCCDFNGRNIPIGTISENTLEEVWNSERLAKVREGIILDNSPNCSSCQRCFSGNA